MQYLLFKVVSVAFGFVAIAAAAIFGRWASRVLTSFKCPCAVDSGAHAYSAGTMTGARQRVAPRTRSYSVKHGRPVIAELLEKAVAEVKTVPRAATAASCALTVGLCVCVCGPRAMVESCKDAMRLARKRHSGTPISLHVEEPDW